MLNKPNKIDIFWGILSRGIHITTDPKREDSWKYLHVVGIIQSPSKLAHYKIVFVHDDGWICNLHDMIEEN